MKYKYIPESFDKKLIVSKFHDIDEFVNLQRLYRSLFERLLLKFVDFKLLDANINLPKVDDEDYNIYHKYSTLGSNYIYVRNNFHVEKLSTEEINELINIKDLDIAFLKKTVSKVMFEDGDYTFYGTPMDETEGKSKGLVIEFAYDQNKIKSIKDLKMGYKVIDDTFKSLSKDLKRVFNSEPSFIVYNAIPDLYKMDNMDIDNEKIIL